MKNYWTQEQIDYLQENYGKYSLPTLAKNLGKSVVAIKVMRQRLGLGPFLMSGEYISLNQLLLAVGGGSSTYNYKMTSWVKNRGLPVHTKKVEKCSFRVVYLDEFWEWADRLQSNLETAQAAQAAASAEVEKLKGQVAKAKEKEKAAKDALAKAKENPEIPESVMEQMRQQVAADAAKAATEELQKKLDAAMSAEAKAVAAHQEAEQKLAAAQKAMKLSNPEIAKLQLLTDQWVGSSNGLRDQLLKAKQADPETAGKVQTAILAAIEQVKAMIAGI